MEIQCGLPLDFLGGFPWSFAASWNLLAVFIPLLLNVWSATVLEFRVGFSVGSGVELGIRLIASLFGQFGVMVANDVPLPTKQ